MDFFQRTTATQSRYPKSWAQELFFFLIFSISMLLISSTAKAAAPQPSCLRSRFSEFLKEVNPFKVNHSIIELKELRKSNSALLGRSINESQARAIQQVNELGSVQEGLTVAESARTARILRNAGFSEAEVTKLSEAGILKYSPVSAAVTHVPDSAFIHRVSLREFDREAIRELKESEKSFHYVIDVDDQIFLLHDENIPGIPKEPLWIAKMEPDAASKLPRSLIIKETGTVRLVDGNPEFQLKHGIDLSAKEADEAFIQLRNKYPEAQLRHQTNAMNTESRVMNCMDIMSGQLAGKSFVKESIVAGNLISIGSIGAAELLGAGRLKGDDGLQLVGADLLGSNAIMLISGVTSRTIALSGMSYLPRLGSRALLGLGTTRVQDQIYKSVLPGEDANERAEALTRFNTVHFFVKLPLNELMDQTFLTKLPVTLFDACRKGGVIKLVLSPQSVRIFEKSVSTAAYFILRGVFVNEGNQPAQEGQIQKMKIKMNPLTNTLSPARETD